MHTKRNTTSIQIVDGQATKAMPRLKISMNGLFSGQMSAMMTMMGFDEGLFRYLAGWVDVTSYAALSTNQLKKLHYVQIVPTVEKHNCSSVQGKLYIGSIKSVMIYQTVLITYYRGCLMSSALVKFRVQLCMLLRLNIMCRASFTTRRFKIQKHTYNWRIIKDRSRALINTGSNLQHSFE